MFITLVILHQELCSPSISDCFQLATHAHGSVNISFILDISITKTVHCCLETIKNVVIGEQCLL